MNSSDAFDQRVMEILDSEEPRLHKLSAQILELKRVKVTRENFLSKYEFRPFEWSDSSGIFCVEVIGSFGSELASRTRISGTQEELINSISLQIAGAEAHISLSS